MAIANDVELSDGVQIAWPDLVNLYGCRVGTDSKIGPFVEIQNDVTVGARCKISSHCFICAGVTIEDGVFIGHGVMFTNDRYPRATNVDGRLKEDRDWTLEPVVVRRGATIGSNATILPGVTVGVGSFVGAGSVVTKDVPDHAITAGVPAAVIADARDRP